MFAMVAADQAIRAGDLGDPGRVMFLLAVALVVCKICIMFQ